MPEFPNTVAVPFLACAAQREVRVNCGQQQSGSDHEISLYSSAVQACHDGFSLPAPMTTRMMKVGITKVEKA
jgi:hypothetical protein